MNFPLHTTSVKSKDFTDLLVNIKFMVCSQFEERLASIFGDANDQVRQACDIIASDPNLAGGYNAVGFSQVL